MCSSDLTHTLKLQPYCRAMAKIALNYVCYRFGHETALHPEFDMLRAFARFGLGRSFEFVVPTLLNHNIMDSAAAFVGMNHHGLLLFAGGNKERWKAAVFVVVEGKTVGRVDLGCREDTLPNRRWFLLSRFDPAQRSVVDFTLPDDIPRAIINPAAIGMHDIWPKEWSC